MVDEQPPEKQPDDSLQPLADPWPAAETTQLPAVDGATAVSPAAASDRGEAPAKWSARAGVPAGGPRRAAPLEQGWVPDRGPRVWWLPILIGVAVMVLFGLAALGLWLAVSGTGPTPTPSSSAPAVPSSPVPTSTRPSLSPSAPPVLLIPVPAVTNVAVDQATGILQSQGLGVKVVTQVSDNVPPGIVTGTNPAAGTPVPQGTVVTLIVAAAPPTSPSAVPSSPGPSS